jgi:hypothetical protein
MKKVASFLAVLVVGAGTLFVSVAHAVSISMNIPGTSPNASTTPGAFVANFYQFALMIGGILAFGVIVYGGVRYMASVGNPSGQSDAKEWIEAALLGLLLLVGAYFVLNIVNPNLTNLALPPIPTVNIASQTTTPATTAACGSLDANNRSQSGQCANSSNGSFNYCCVASGVWSCQSTVCGTTACGSGDAYGVSESGICPGSGNCCPTKDNDTGFVTYSCKATACQ